MNGIFSLSFTSGLLLVFLFIIPNVAGEEKNEGHIIKNIDGLESLKQYDVVGGKIVNHIREEFVYPNDPLEYQITVYNPNEYDTWIMYILHIEQGYIYDDKNEEIIQSRFRVPAMEDKTYSIPFNLDNLGAYRIELKLRFDAEKNPEELKQITGLDNPITENLELVYLDVKSPTHEVLENSNRTQTTLVIITGILAGATIIGIIINSRQTIHSNEITRRQLRAVIDSNEYSKKQLIVSNFDIITNYIGNERTRLARRILYKHYNSKFFNKFIDQYPNIEKKSDFDYFNEWVKYVGAIYNRVSFLLEQDDDLHDKIISYHGYTVGIVWKIFDEFDKLWQKEDKTKSYSEFERIGKKCYEEWQPKITEFLENKTKQNENLDKFNFPLAPKKYPLE